MIYEILIESSPGQPAGPPIVNFRTSGPVSERAFALRRAVASRNTHKLDLQHVSTVL